MNQLTIERAFPAAPRQLWNEFTNAENLASWFWPASFETEVEIAAKVGGIFTISSSVRSLDVSGAITKCEEPHELAATWKWNGESFLTFVETVFSPAPIGTTLTLTHSQFESAQTRDDNIVGWNDCLDRLADRLRRT